VTPSEGVTHRAGRVGSYAAQVGAIRLRLRPPLPADEAAFLAAHEAMACEDFAFGLGFEPGQPWQDYLARLERQRCGIDLPPGLVPATFLVADVDGHLVGRSSIRHELNDFLRREGGHIGYGVLPEHRRRGYATEILRQSLVVARALGVDRVLVTCDHDNIGSATVIERCGGVLHSVIDVEDGSPKRRYWID
jgi:predicted acetyltransferase